MQTIRQLISAATCSAPTAPAVLSRKAAPSTTSTKGVMEGTVPFSPRGAGKACETYYKVFGDLAQPGATPLVVLHGGPGVVHDYLLSLADLTAARGTPVVFYDQLGNGRSTRLPEKKGDTKFWTEELFIRQLEGLMDHLGVARGFDLLGHSWGGMLAARFATRHPRGLRRLILADTPASMALWVDAANRLRKTLPQNVQDTLDKHEKDGTTESKEYHDAVNVFYGNFVCRLDPMPEDIARAFGALEVDNTVYMTMNGPSEFFVTGSLKTWTIEHDIGKIRVPTLLLNSQYDEAQDSVMLPYFRKLEKVKWVTFENASHMPQYEQRARYMEVVGAFLADDA